MALAAGNQSRPRTVLMTADTVGGIWSYIAGLCATLPEIRFIVATMGPRPRQTQRVEIARLDNVVLEESDYRLEWMSNSGADIAESNDWLVGIIARHGVDLVHINGFAHARLGVGLPVLAVAHSDVLSWWEAVHKCVAPPDWDGYRRRTTAGLVAADRIVAPTAAVLRDLERHYLPLENKGVVIGNGVNDGAFPPPFKQALVAAAGRVWDEAKNLAALEAVAPELAWPVEIAGDTKHPERGGMSFERVRLLGVLSPAEMSQCLGRASIFAAPARYEPFGLAILEAARAGCALVLGDIPSLRENWNGAAVFVPTEDRMALRSAINRLISRPGDRARLAAAARYRARRFTLPRMGRAYAHLYSDMMQSVGCAEKA